MFVARQLILVFLCAVMQALDLGNPTHGHIAAQISHMHGGALRVSRILSQPIQMLYVHGRTHGTLDTPTFKLKIDAPASGRQVTHPTSSTIVSGSTPVPTSGTDCRFFCRRKVMIRDYRSPKTPFNVEMAVNPEKLKSDRIDLGFFMMKAYPKNETTLQAVDLNEYATYTETFGHSSLKNTYTNPRRPAYFYANESAAVYHPRRGTPAMKEMEILDGFEGYAVHDHYSSYYQFDLYHVACNAHQLRELIHAYEEHQQQWAQKMISYLLEAKSEVDLAIEQGKTALSDERIHYYDTRYSRILREGRQELPVLAPPEKVTRGRKAQHKVKNLHDRLVNHKHETIAFNYDPSVPFDNNQGERDIRMAKTKQKISGCFRSITGAENFCRIRGYISTARKQGRNIYEASCDAFDSNAFDPRTG